jgi:hypothetical protein
MKPTEKLRFIERKVPMHPFYKDASTGGTAYHVYRVLQQWWEQKQWAHDDWIIVGGEWRDVPLEQEEA